MKRCLSVLLVLCVLLLAGCGKKSNTPPPAEPEPTEDIASVPAPPPPVEDKVTVYTFGKLEIPVEKEYGDLLIVNTELEAWNAHRAPLISFSEKASVEAGQLDHPGEDWGDGMLCSVTRLDRIGFESFLSGDDSPGSVVFARDGEDTYYLIDYPTDVRLYRGDKEPDSVSRSVWSRLLAWAEALPDEILSRNAITAYDAHELLDADYTYPGEHIELGYRIPGEPMDLVLLALSQPVKQGEGGVWCVERVRYVYSDYDMTDTHMVFPAALGIDLTAADYYARLQQECDAGEHSELLTPQGAALGYARTAAWLFGEDVSATDFEVVEALG